jgi:dihydroxyacetone kinase-like protein
MKKFLNDPVNFVDQMLEGIYKAHPAVTHLAGDMRCLVTSRIKPGKVGIAVGGVFQSPSAEQMYQVTKHIDQGAGVLYIYGNYSGDIINFDMAAELADLDGIAVKQVVGNDDVASSRVGEEHKRRGVAGIFFVYKAAGAAAAEGLSLDDVARLADKARLRTRTMGVALSSCVVPEIGHATFSIGEDEMEIGMGIHGEPGISRKKLAPADAVIDEMMERIFVEQDYKRGDTVAVLVNGLGGTPMEELYILFRRVSQLLEERDVTAKYVWVGEFATSMEMAGASVSILHLDEELNRLVAAPANTPFFKHILG